MELRGKYTLDAMVADLHAILAHLWSPPVLVGVSIGGLSALAAAGEAIAPIARALVLVDVTLRINAGGAEKIRLSCAATYRVSKAWTRPLKP